MICVYNLTCESERVTRSFVVHPSVIMSFHYISHVLNCIFFVIIIIVPCVNPYLDIVVYNTFTVFSLIAVCTI